MNPRCWVIIPAAGASRRMGGAVPKQYLALAGRTVVEWSLAPFLTRRDIEGIVAAISPEDATFASLAGARHAKIQTTIGGAERVDSVQRGLASLPARDDDWVLVHDAARPCLHADDLSKLIDTASADGVGGLLASPAADTLKRAGASHRVEATVSRERIWRALTPQMFRFAPLQEALTRANAAGVAITDEASAMEYAGHQPLLIAGRTDNIKITVPEDLMYAEYILKSRGAK